MLRIISTATNEPISIPDALAIGTDPYETIDDMMARLLEQQQAGLIRIEPDAESLQRMAVRAGLQAYTASARTEDGVRQFAADRRGGRVNRTARRIAELDDVHRREVVRSIQRFMLMDGPKAYESQAALLGALDPTVNAELIARQSAEAVGDAVRTGIATGRNAVQVNEQAS